MSKGFCAIFAVVVAIVVGSTAPLIAQAAPVVTLAQAVDEALAKNDRLITQHDSDRAGRSGRAAGAQSVSRPKVTPNILGSFGQTDVSSQTYRVDLSQRLHDRARSCGSASAPPPRRFPASPGTSETDIRFYNADTTLTLSAAAAARASAATSRGAP